MKFPKAARLRRRRSFLQIQQRGRRLYSSGDVVVLGHASGEPHPRIGITVSSKVGNAVERNRVKRWVREAFREIRAEFPPSDVVVIARSGAKAMGLPGARRALAAAREALVSPAAPGDSA